MLEVRSLNVSYGQHRALEGAALRVAPREIVVILGANGAGKSTLLKAICGICEGRVTGSVVLDGEEVLGQGPDRIVEAGLALVPEGRGVFPDLTVQENLRLGAHARRARDEEAANLEQVLDLFPKLAERRRQTVRTMSGGEQQMVAIGRAMMSNPAILALDEPSLGLSPLLCKELFQNLRRVAASGVGILLVEQNARQSLAIADRGYLLENGTIVHDAAAAELMSDPAVQKAYLGGGVAPRPAAPASQTPPQPAPRTPAGPSPAEIARAAMARVQATPRPAQSAPAAAKPPAAPPASAPPAAAGTMDLEALVARAARQSSRRPAAAEIPRANGNTPPPHMADRPGPPPTPMPDLGSSADRLRAALEEIEAAARRAETYRTGPSGPAKRR